MMPRQLILILAASGLASGCVCRQKELEEVAKDWCLVIRASQVIPVYPLTEDLQPDRHALLLGRAVSEAMRR